MLGGGCAQAVQMLTQMGFPADGVFDALRATNNDADEACTWLMESAAAAAMSRISMPEMRRYGYDESFALGVIAIGGQGLNVAGGEAVAASAGRAHAFRLYQPGGSRNEYVLAGAALHLSRALPHARGRASVTHGRSALG